MVDISFEESILLQLMRAVRAVGLDVVVIGNVAAALLSLAAVFALLAFWGPRLNHVRKTHRGEDGW